MTAATSTAIRVPVRTWQEKAILGSLFATPLWHLHEEQEGQLGDVSEHLLDQAATDRFIDTYMEGYAPIAVIMEMVIALRAITPGPDAVLDVPADFGLLEKLDELIDCLTETKVSEFLPHVKHCSQRQVAEATIVAMDLRDELVARLYADDLAGTVLDEEVVS